MNEPRLIVPDWKEEDRLKAIDSYHILDTPKEEEFDGIVQMAARICRVPIALISFVTTGRQWFKSTVGTDLQETPLDCSICSHAILQKDLMVVPDTTMDDRTRNNPLVKGDPHLRFYAGALLETSDRLPLGTICVLDFAPRTLDEHQCDTMRFLARQVMAQLELRRTLSQLRRALEAKEQLNTLLGDRAAHLESLVQQRTEKLSETVRELESFAYTISHDMRAPLRAMIGFSEAVKEDYSPLLDAHGIDYLRRIASAGHRMDQLIQDVLAFSRLSNADTSFQAVDVDLLIREVIRSYPNLSADFVSIAVDTLPPVKGSSALLTQCFSNLLENGAKYSKKGIKGKIHVWAEVRGSRTKLFFEDQGIGIPEQNLQRIFEIYQRVGRDNEGSGIGLAVVRKTVEKMGGTVGVESEVGKGTRFWVDLETAG